MSARDKIIAIFPTRSIGEAVADEILNEHAHELAEQIRNSMALRDYTDDHMSDMYEAANEIDPEAQK